MFNLELLCAFYPESVVQKFVLYILQNCFDKVHVSFSRLNRADQRWFIFSAKWPLIILYSIIHPTFSILAPSLWVASWFIICGFEEDVVQASCTHSLSTCIKARNIPLPRSRGRYICFVIDNIRTPFS